MGIKSSLDKKDESPTCHLCGKPTTWCGQPDGYKCLNTDCPPKDSAPIILQEEQG